jgi:YVTN family beta-propeller protein
VLLASCGGDDPTSVPDLANLSVSVVSGDAQRGSAGQELPEPLVVFVEETGGGGGAKPVKDVLVNFQVLGGDGRMFAGSALTNKDGIARDYWTLGPEAGTNTVEVRAVDPETGEKLIYGRFSAVGVRRLAIVSTGDVIDAATNTVNETLPWSGKSFAFTPDRRTVYIPYAQSVHARDAATGALIADIPLDSYGLADYVLVAPDGALAYAVGRFLPGVLVIDVGTNTVTETLPALGWAAELSPDGAYLYTIDDYTFYRVDLATGAVRTASRFLGHSLAISPDGRTAYLGQFFPFGIVVFDLDTWSVTETLPAPDIDHQTELGVSPDGAYLYSLTGQQCCRAKLTVREVATGALIATLEVGRPGFDHTTQSLAFSKDGAFAYVANWTDQTVSVIDVATHSVVATVPVSGNPRHIETFEDDGS